MKIKFISSPYTTLREIKQFEDNLIFVCISSNAIIRLNKEDAGIDLSNLNEVEVELNEKPFLVNTGLKIKLPYGFFAMITPRSSLPLKMGLTVANSPGIIDWGYRGEVKIQLQIINQETFVEAFEKKENKIIIPKHTRLAQMLILPAIYPYSYQYPEEIVFCVCMNDYIFENFQNLFPTDRGEGGFGSTKR